MSGEQLIVYRNHTIAVVVPAYNEETYDLGFGDVRFGDFANLPILNLQEWAATSPPAASDAAIVV